jgi:hypothetical protein
MHSGFQLFDQRFRLPLVLFRRHVVAPYRKGDARQLCVSWHTFRPAWGQNPPDATLDYHRSA